MVDLARTSGTVTFLFTDIEGSTALWDRSPRAMSAALAQHDAALRGAIERHGGHIFATGGDGFAAVFASAADASRAAIDGQVAIASTSWPSDAIVRVRMGMHSGVAEVRAGDYFGAAVNRAARVGSSAHGGQIVLSGATAELVADERWTLLDLGRHRLRGLERPERLFRLIGDGMLDNDQPLRLGPDEIGNLPHRRAKPIGRDRELAQLAGLVNPGSLVTVTGAGGVGKTRLALTVARSLSVRFVDGAWLVELAEVSSSSDVAAAVAAALHLQVAASDPVAGIVRALSHQQALLVLDNCEHVLDGAGRLVDSIGVSCPEVSILATSRQALGVDGEQLVVLSPLSLTVDSGLSDAAQLLCQRAAGVAGSFDPRPTEVPIVERICARLDGLPLAIELAATRLSAMSVEELDAGLDDRFRLSKVRTGTPGRHHNLGALVAWSYELLSPTEQMVFDRLSVFIGGFDLAAAEAVAEAPGELVEDALVSLVDKSLVAADRDSTGTRYRQLETLREFGIERLRHRALLDDARLRHLHYFVSVTAQADAGVKGPDELRWHRYLTVNWPNIRSAMQFACDENLGDEACRLVHHLLFWAVNRLPMDMLEMSSAVLALPAAADHPLRPVVAASTSYFAGAQGDADGARDLIGVARTEEARLQTVPSPYVPSIETFCSESPRRLLDLALEVQARAAGDPWANALGLLQEAIWHATVMSAVDLTTNEHAAHLGRIHEAVAAAEALGNPCGIAYASMALGTHLLRTDPDAAMALLTRGLDLARPLGLSLPIGNSRRDLIRLHTEGGRPAEAISIGADEVRTSQRRGAHASAWAAVISCMPAMTELGLEDVAATCLAISYATPEPAEWVEYFQFSLIESRLRERFGADDVSAILRDRRGIPRTEATTMFLTAVRDLDA